MPGQLEQLTKESKVSLNPVTTEEEDTIDLVELLYRLLAGWKMIVCLALVFAIVACVISVCFVTPLYQATSTIYVLSRRDSAINMSDLQIGTALTNDYVKVFSMWEVHEQVVSNLGLTYTYKQMKKMLSVVNDNNTRMLDITITSDDPEEAAAIANEYAVVASDYIAETMSMDRPNIMSVALVPTNPVNANAVRNTVLGFLLGALCASGIITVHMITDDKYKTAEDIRKATGLITLAIVPEESTDEKTKSSRRKKSSRRTGGKHEHTDD